MLDKDEYDKAEKKQRKRITARQLKQKKVNCGNCGHYLAETGMCNKDWPGVAGKLSARGARTDHNTRVFCGMSGRGFYPSEELQKELGVEAPVRKNKPGPKPKAKQLPGQGA